MNRTRSNILPPYGHMESTSDNDYEKNRNEKKKRKAREKGSINEAIKASKAPAMQDSLKSG